MLRRSLAIRNPAAGTQLGDVISCRLFCYEKSGGWLSFPPLPLENIFLMI